MMNLEDMIEKLESLTTETPALHESQQIVCTRRCGSAWPNGDAKAIKAARDAYDSGHYEMATKRHNGFDFLLLIKRRIPTERRNYWNHLRGTQ